MGIELDENPWDAISHELVEESGYEIAQFKVLQPKGMFINTDQRSTGHPLPISYNTHPFDEAGSHKHTDAGYLLLTSEHPRKTPEDGESLDIQAFGRNELLALSEDQVFDNVRQHFIWALDVVEKGNSHWEFVEATKFS